MCGEVCFKENYVPIWLVWVNYPILFLFQLDFQSNFQYSDNKMQVKRKTHLQEPSLSFSSVNFTVKLKMSHFLHAQLKSLS